MNIRFLTLAQQEVDEAFAWFNEKDEGKGVDFLDDLDRAVRLVKTYPFASAEIEPEIRRRILPSFPYSLIYGVDDEIIVVIAVAHFHRAPRYWVDRLRL